jgi:hypothetical protein
MDIQKLEQIVLKDVKADAQQLIDETNKEMKLWLTEQTNLLKEENQEDIDRIKSDHTSKVATMKAFWAADFHKNLVKAKKEKFSKLASELMKALYAKIEKNPDWILEQAFSQLPVKSGNIWISQDLSKYLTQEKVEVFLKKVQNFTFGGVDKELESGLCFELSSVRYIFLLQELVDQFIETESASIMRLLIP